MSFLSAPRFAFAGRFLSDVSTINNLSGDVGWNPQGGAAFEFLGCRVSGGWLSAAAAEDDPVLGYAVSGRPGASSAKMVDLDPDWRMASQLWGLSVRLFDPATGELAFIGRYDVAAFRDLWGSPQVLCVKPRKLAQTKNMGPAAARGYYARVELVSGAKQIRLLPSL